MRTSQPPAPNAAGAPAGEEGPLVGDVSAIMELGLKKLICYAGRDLTP